jgi:hypothetical protein
MNNPRQPSLPNGRAIAMNQKTDSERKSKGKQRTTLVYGKRFAFLGLVCGIVLVFGTPGAILIFNQGLGPYDLGWLESPSWIIPTMLCIAMGGGVLTIVLSVLFGVLIPSRIVRESSAGEDHEPVAERES